MVNGITLETFNEGLDEYSDRPCEKSQSAFFAISTISALYSFDIVSTVSSAIPISQHDWRLMDAQNNSNIFLIKRRLGLGLEFAHVGVACFGGNGDGCAEELSHHQAGRGIGIKIIVRGDTAGVIGERELALALAVNE